MATQPRDLERDPLLGTAIALAGPQQPLGIVAAPSDKYRLGAKRFTDRPGVWVVGLHGGAGATTLTALLGSTAQDAGRCWPLPSRPPDHPLPGLESAGLAPAAEASTSWAPSPVLVVARTHRAGLDAAEAAIRTWASGFLDDMPLLGLVLVDDGPRLPSAVVSRCRRVAAMSPFCWHLAWREPWRQGVSVDDGLPLRVRRTVADIHKRALQARDLATQGSPEPAAVGSPRGGPLP